MEEEFNNFSKSVTSLKAIAVFGIIIIHYHYLRTNFDASNIILLAFTTISNIGVDIFTFLSGIMLTISLINTKDISWKEWYKKRAIRLYPILIIVVIFSYIFNFFFYKPRDINTIFLIMSGIHTIFHKEDLSIPVSLWFIPFIITCYLIFPLIIYSIKKKFKFTVIIGISTYILFVIFSIQIYQYIHNVFGIFQEGNQFLAFVPRYFEFFFGVVIGFWIGNNNLTKLLDRRIELLMLIICIVFSFLYLFLVSYENDKIFPYGTRFLINSLCYPLISMSFILFFINFNRNKTIFNKILEFPGKESFEIFLINEIAIHTITLLFTPVDILSFFIIIFLCIIVSIILATPFYYLNKHITREKKINDFFIIFSLSLIIYALLFFSLWRVVEFTTLFSIILICIIFVNIFTIKFCTQNLRKFKK